MDTDPPDADKIIKLTFSVPFEYPVDFTESHVDVFFGPRTVPILFANRFRDRISRAIRHAFGFSYLYIRPRTKEDPDPTPVVA